MKRRRIVGALLSFLMLSSAVVGLVPLRASAKAVDDPEGVEYDENGYLTIENQEALAAKIKEAQDLGVKVEVTEQENPAVYVHDENISNTINDLKTHNTKQIDLLNQAIQDQLEKNKDYNDKLKAAIMAMLKGNSEEPQWKVEEFGKFLLGEEVKNDDLIWAKLAQKMSLTSIVTHSPDTKIKEKHLQHEGYLTVGDTIVYENVFINTETDKWVDIRLTVKNIEPFETSKDVLNVEPTNQWKTQLQNYGGWGGIHPRQMMLAYRTDDMQVQVDFIDHKTGDPVSLIPLIVLVDIDSFQAVRLDEPATYRVLRGQDINEMEGNIYQSNDIEDKKQGVLREHWVMFTTSEKTSSFTYTFYAQKNNKNGVLQGVGGDDINYTPPTDKPVNETAEVTILRQPIYHKVKYQFVGNAPASAKVPEDPKQYLVKDALQLQGNLDPITDDKGTWTFQGWFSDEACTAEMKDGIAVNQDQEIFGKWALAPKDTPKPPKPPVPKDPETPEKPETPEQPETPVTPEKPVQERIPATPSIDLKAILDRTEVRIPRAGVGAPTH